ncbi:hypothetical protein DL98DRAFT_542281 [Cadophora sp. DSE1049]|nr:hypothetical protein DL98DRAFT_542281 [Cadophora sp. DSE1049]
MQIPASQVMLSDGPDEIKTSSSECSAEGVTKKGLRYHDCDTVDEIFNLEVPHYNRLILEWAAHMLQLPISKVPTYPSPTRAIQEPSLFSRQVKKAAQLSCYNKITAFDFRGEGLTRTNKSVNGFLCPVFQGDQLLTGEKTPAAENRERERQTGNFEENSTANPQTQNGK